MPTQGGVGVGFEGGCGINTRSIKAENRVLWEWGGFSFLN